MLLCTILYQKLINEPVYNSKIAFLNLYFSRFIFYWMSNNGKNFYLGIREMFVCLCVTIVATKNSYRF